MKKALNIIYYTLTGLLAAFTIVLVIAGIGSYVNQEPLNLFGYGMAPVGSESMEPDIKKGDFVFTDHNFEYSNLVVGDDIIFIGQDANGKQIVVVHRIVEIGSE